ncbi:MAG: FHA domain-containing protein [Hyphomicrobium sp.]
MTTAPAFDTSRVEPSVYKIYTLIPEKDNQFSVSSGTGFLVSGQTTVLTNFHVVEGGARFYIAYRDGRDAKLIEARRADSRPNVDLALLEAREDLPGMPLKIGDYEPDKLVNVVAIGFPGAANLNKELVPAPDARGIPLSDLDSTITTGVVSRMTFTNLKVSDSQILSARTVQHNAAINPGNSGGPLLDTCGWVVGVNSLQGLNSQGLFFSIHTSEVTRFLTEARIPFASTVRPCNGGGGGDLATPLIFGMTATMALGALFLAARRRGAAQLLASMQNGLVNLKLPFGPLAGLAARLVGGLGGKSGGGEGGGLRGAGAQGADLCLQPADGGPPLRLDASGRALILGRGHDCDLIVESDTVSKQHASLAWTRASQRVQVTDLGSSNGTYLDGARISNANARLGSRLRFGTVDYKIAVAPQRAASGGRSGRGWMLSGFDASGRALQFELCPEVNSQTGADQPSTWTFGRDANRAAFVINDQSVSALHAQIMYDPGKPLALRDRGSSNGTRVDGVPAGADSTVTLSDTGVEIAFGLAKLRLSRLT